MAENLEKKQVFQPHALKFLFVCRQDYCLNNGFLLVKSRDAHRLLPMGKTGKNNTKDFVINL